MYVHIPYAYKFSRDIFFMDYPNLGFPRFYFHGSLVITHAHVCILYIHS